jgi:hypothetical protein
VKSSASAAIKAAEPVAISTASKVSHSAQTVWSTTKEVFSASKKAEPEGDGDEAAKPEEEEPVAEVAEEAPTEEKSSEELPSDLPVVSESEVLVEEQESAPAAMASSAEPEIVSSSVESVAASESADGGLETQDMES